MIIQQLEQSIHSGINFLTRSQLENGGFISLSSPDPTQLTRPVKFHTNFSTSLILHNICNVSQTEKISILKKRAANYLLSQKSADWSWNYWDRSSIEYNTIPYPDDLDDTFCALSALQRYDRTIINGDALGQIISLLTAIEVTEGGPYKTWIVDSSAESSWKVVDTIVNLNIAYFLKSYGISLPALDTLFQTSFEKNEFTTPYYPYPYPYFYFFSRIVKGTQIKKKLENIIIQYLAESGNPLDISLCLLALDNLKLTNFSYTKYIHLLTDMQQKDGSWIPSAFYTGVNPKRDSNFYGGSPELSTSFCVSAIQNFSRNASSKHSEVFSLEKRYSSISDSIMLQISNRFSTIPHPLQGRCFEWLKKIKQNDSDGQIRLLPWYFMNSLGKENELISKDTLIPLCCASVYGWIAYTIYDDILDEESEVDILPVANVCLRELTTIFTSVLPSNTGFQSYFIRVMDELENANQWEMIHTRTEDWKNTIIPDYSDCSILAKRSLGHALGCIALLVGEGVSIESQDVKHLHDLFCDFLIARQLNDDMHDWENDLRKGQINSVASFILKKINKTKNVSKKQYTYKNLQVVFWTEVVDDVCNIVDTHINNAHNHLLKISNIKNKSFFEKILQKEKKIIELTLDEKKQTQSFIKSYTTYNYID